MTNGGSEEGDQGHQRLSMEPRELLPWHQHLKVQSQRGSKQELKKRRPEKRWAALVVHQLSALLETPPEHYKEWEGLKSCWSDRWGHPLE